MMCRLGKSVGMGTECYKMLRYVSAIGVARQLPRQQDAEPYMYYKGIHATTFQVMGV